MHIYKLSMIYYLDGDCAWDIDYVTHDNKFTKEEFESMCQEALNGEINKDNKYSERDNFIIREYLKSKYGFKELNVTEEFVYNSEIEEED